MCCCPTISGKTDGGALQTCVVSATETEHVGVCIVSWLVGAEWCVTPYGLPDTNFLHNTFVQNKKRLKKNQNTHRANQREEEARANAGSDVSDGQDKTCGHALLVGFVRER